MEKIYFTIPKVCPICNLPTKISSNGTFLICDNPNCGAKIEGKFLRFIGTNGLDIESMSIATIRDLIRFGWLTKMSDIFTLKSHREEWIAKKGYGIDSVDKILEGIPSSIETWKIIASAGIPDVEKQTAKLLEETFVDYISFRNAVKNKYDFSKIKGIGTITANKILTFNYDEIDDIMNYLNIKEKITGSKLANMSFCITGKLSMKREELVKLIEANGGKSATVNKNLTYLICNNPASNSGKSKKAKELGIPIITEEDFFKMIV